MPNNDDIVPTPSPSQEPTETDPMTALKELDLAVQWLREAVKACPQDWELTPSDTWSVQVRASWGATFISVNSFLTAVEQKMQALNKAMRPINGG
jgi:hypothetical protein